MQTCSQIPRRSKSVLTRFFFFQETHVTTSIILLHFNRFTTAAMYFIRSNNLKLVDGEEQKESTEEEGEKSSLLLPLGVKPCRRPRCACVCACVYLQNQLCCFRRSINRATPPTVENRARPRGARRAARGP